MTTRLPFQLFSISVVSLLLMLLCGCASQKVESRQQKAQSQRSASPPAFQLSAFPISDLPDEEVVGPPPVPLPATTNRITLLWHQPGTCYGTRVEQSTNLVAWSVIGFVFNEYIRHDSDEAFTFTNTFNPVYFRVAAFNP